jgi:hypothetical protein
MIHNNLDILRNKKFDVVIIGAGPAGITLAIELEKRSISTALIEAGAKDYSEDSQNFYKGIVEGEFPRELSVSRLRMLGGTTGHWGGTCRTLDSYDFDKWPIKKKDLDPYLLKAASILNIKPEFNELKVSEDLKLIEFQTSDVRFGDKFYKNLEDSKFINLFLDLPVVKIKGEEQKVSSVECHSKNFGEIEIKGNLFILATGGIENSRILLLTKLHNKNLFNPNLPIGNYWYEHPFNHLGNAIVNENKLNNYLKNSLNKFQNMFNFGDESTTYNFSPTKKLIQKENILNSCCFLTIIKRSNKNFKNIAKNVFCLAPEFSKNLLKLYNKKLQLTCGVSITSSWEQEPDYYNRIELSKTDKDIFGLPVAKLVYKKSELVRKTARVCMQEIGKFLVNNDLGRLSINSFLFEKNEKYLSEAGWHHLGGTVMGKNIKDSVVDENLKIHGSKNMYVLGSSVFPTGGHANPTLTIVQLALRLSDTILKSYKNS